MKVMILNENLCVADSGVHGGLVVLESSFSGDTIATALGIPPSKNIVRRHLITEFESLVMPARQTLTQGFRGPSGGGGSGGGAPIYERSNVSRSSSKRNNLMWI